MEQCSRAEVLILVADPISLHVHTHLGQRLPGTPAVLVLLGLIAAGLIDAGVPARVSDHSFMPLADELFLFCAHCFVEQPSLTCVVTR